jgi:hypothetical protein
MVVYVPTIHSSGPNAFSFRSISAASTSLTISEISQTVALNTGSHGGRDFERLVEAHKVVVHEMRGDRRNVMVQVLREGVCASRKAAHVHPHGQVLPSDIRRADVLFIRRSRDRVPLGPVAYSRIVPGWPPSMNRSTSCPRQSRSKSRLSRFRTDPAFRCGSI